MDEKNEKNDSFSFMWNLPKPRTGKLESPSAKTNAETFSNFNFNAKEKSLDVWKKFTVLDFSSIGIINFGFSANYFRIIEQV